VKLKKVVIKGFMRFKDRVEIEFPQGQVTLIAGENGAGKTSILDAICICFYGKTFRTSGATKSGYLSTPDLINHDCDKASIEVEFENYGHNYVVTRNICHNKSESELFEDGISKAVGRAVYDYIKNIAIGLDWEGFRKSTVILQGEMSTLTKADPAERKEAFRKLFGLERYVTIYDQIAKTKIDEKTATKEKIEEANKVLLEEVKKIPSLKNELRNLGQSIRRLKKQKSRLIEKLKERKREKESLEGNYRKYTVLKERLANLNVNIAKTNSKIVKSKRELIRLQRMKEELPSLEKSYKEFTELQNKVDRLKPIRQKFDKLSKKLAELIILKTEKESNLSALKSDIDETTQEIKRLEEQIPKRTKIKKAQRELRQLEKEKDKLGKQKAGVEADLRNISKSLKDLQRKLNEVKGKKKCPVCLQIIKDPSQVTRHYSKENAKLLTQQRNKQKLLESIATKLGSTEKEFEKANSALGDLQNRFNRAQLVNRAKKALKSLETRRKQNQRIVQTTDARIEKQKESISKLNFDEKSYATDESNLSLLRKQKIAEKYSNAKVQVKRLPEVSKGITALQKVFASMNEKRDRLQSKLISFGDIERNYKKARRNFENAQISLNQNQAQLVEEKTNKVNTRKQLKELFGKKKNVEDNKKKIEYLEKEMMILEELRNVFKNIPENILRRLRSYIEKEGNDLITELSDSEITALNIEKETLNVAATMMGEVRPIHYFSEGQKTRINMALRVAISRILSKLPQTEEHAYAVMRTLFVDEGDFGNLDESGIQDAVSVIRNLTKEFDRVVIISHVPAIREIFQGYVLEVVKTGVEQSTIKTYGLPQESIVEVPSTEV
jgi:DNA repair exonuclease SbcCD ATPase subunit